MIIGISGKIGSGKDTVGSIIQYLTTPLNEGTTLTEFYKHEWKARKSSWQIKKFADKLKECTSIILNIPREDLEKIEVKNRELGEEWIRYGKARGFFIDGNTRIMNNVGCTKEEYEEELKTNWQTAYKLEHTPRTILQMLGTEVCRHIHPNFWVNALFNEYKTIVDNTKIDWKDQKSANNSINNNLIYPNWIITDMRFPNELKAVKDRNGITIRVNRFDDSDMQASARNQHLSETALDDATFDYTIDNNSTIEELIEKVKEILIKEKII